MHHRHSLVAATWNVRSLVERAGGDQRICRSRPHPQACEGSTAVDHKLDLLVSELKQYGVSVAAIQETKWFGKDMWEAQGYTFLHSGCPLPIVDGPVVTNEGGGTALDVRATAV